MHMLREWAECELPEIWSLACKCGAVTPLPECAKGIEAKFRIAEVLGIDINCVQRFKAKTAL
jgi:hypothetical protein